MPHWKKKGKGGDEAKRQLRTFDPLAGEDGADADVLICSLPTDSPSARAALLRVLGTAAPGFHIVRASYGAVKADKVLRELLLVEEGALFVVPATPRGEGDFLCCGGPALLKGAANSDGGVLQQCERAVIRQAQDDKGEGRPFCRLVRHTPPLWIYQNINAS